MKQITKFLTLIAAIFAVQSVNAQCPAGQVDVEFDFSTDSWGYELYWEVVPTSNNCGTGTIASGGNPAVGCANPGGITAGGYADNDLITENIGCIVEGTILDLIMIDDWGDGGTVADLKLDGILIASFTNGGSSSTHTFLAKVPNNNMAMDSVYFNGLSDETEKNVYFSQIPLRHAKLDTMYFAGAFANKGLLDQANVTFGVDVSGPWNFNESNNVGTISSGANATDSLTVPFNHMKSMGTYNFEFYVESDSIDEIPDNNIMENTIQVTDTVYARDQDNNPLGYAVLTDPAQQIEARSVAYYINDDDVATSISISLWDFGGTETGAVVQLYLADNADTKIYKSEYHVMAAGEMNAAAGAADFLTLKLDFDGNDQALTGPAVIPAGFYTAGITVLSGIARVGVTPDVAAAPQTQFVLSGGTLFYSTGSLLQIRLNVAPDPCNSLALSSSIDDVSCNGGNDGEISLIAAGGTAPYSFVWDDSSTNTSINGLSAGTYGVVVTDADGCEVEGLYDVDEADVLTASVNTNSAACGNANGNATASATGGSAPYNYIWNNAMSISFLNNISAGGYDVTVTDDNGCVASASGTVASSNSTITLSTSVTSDDACGYNVGGALASATSTGGSVSYLWDNGDATALTSGLVAGTYSVTATDADGCSSASSVTITELAPAVMATVSSTDASCGASDGTASVSINTAYTYVWDDAASQTTAMATGLEANVYYVMVTDTVTTCQGGWTANVNNPTAAISLATTVTNADCYGSSTGDITVSGTSASVVAGYSLWTADGDSLTSVISSGTESFSGLPVDDYILVGADIAGCITFSSLSINEPSMLMASVSSNDVTCNGDTDGDAAVVAMGGTSGYTYAWDNGSTTSAAAGLSAGNENVTVTDANGCMVVETVNVGTPSAISLDISSEDISCNGDGNGEINLMASGGGVGGFTYAWDNGLAAVANQASLAAATYNVTVTDANGCTAEDDATIAEPGALGVTVTATNDFVCFGDADGAATSSINGGTGPFTYVWSGNGSTTANNTNVDAGAEDLTIIDANGCSATSNSITITESPSAVVAAVSGTNESCFNCADGTASVVASGGTAPYTYSWNIAGSTSSLTDIDPICPFSTIICNVTDADGCVASGQVNILCDDVNAIEEVEGITSMVVYPNPNNGIFNVELNSATKAKYTFVVRNVIGQTVSIDSETINGNYIKTIDLSTQTDGIYFLTVKSADSEITAKIVVR